MPGRARANGEGSIFPYRNGYAAYVWVTKPDGKRTRKYVYGPTREAVHDKWIKLHQQAKAGPVVTRIPTLGSYLESWLRDVVEPNLAPATAANYDMFVRLYIAPELGSRRLDKLTVREVQTWLNKLRTACQCCLQGKDAARPEGKRKCCAVGRCCQRAVSERTARDAWTTLRAALNNAVRDELLTRNPAALLRVAEPRPRKTRPWSVDEVRQFLESARAEGDPLYATYVLILVLGLRRGEVLGLRWEDVDLAAGELAVAYQLQRIRRQLLHRETKTESSDATLPLPAICATALRSRREDQQRHREHAGRAWQDTGLVFTTRLGTPVEPRNFHREFKTRCRKAGVREISVHTTRRTCASLLVALDVHPRVTMQILRHSQIAVTMNIYSEVATEATEKALRRLGEQFI
ncbi:tyrosine-type recombinase/integrase [Micromonospora sp. KC723]|uniref:tyrosine-type recombinase/integrase n=1 Tax=Micromonospora sp. KC723 TaxID=2530381 RepID=UPI00104AA1F4|nr:tyrosine-type recombinase/integrase [Micromonospora sp. KC723]TDB69581.1 site-specific integrase [Micromonospora sp. KC723]